MSKHEHTWPALESSPDSMNKFIESVGVKSVKLVDIFSFDEDALEFIPRPQYAVIFCFPEYSKVEKMRLDLYEKLVADGEAEKNKDIFFMKQKIHNACGTFSLIHSLANLENSINLGNGPLAKWLAAAKDVGVDERSDLLANDTAMSTAHQGAAESGSSAQPDEVEHHFICYVNRNGTLYEIDSSAPCPRAMGPTTFETMARDAGNACKDLMEKMDNVSFAAMALVDNTD